MNLDQNLPKTRGKDRSPRVPRKPKTDVITLDECKKYLEEYHLSDDRIMEIRNNLTGIVDSLLNAYIEQIENSDGHGIF
jgi:hypothetical protein